MKIKDLMKELEQLDPEIEVVVPNGREPEDGYDSLDSMSLTNAIKTKHPSGHATFNRSRIIGSKVILILY